MHKEAVKGVKKIRPQLPVPYQKIYKKFYIEYALSATKARKLAKLAESWYHKKVSSLNQSRYNAILEVGAGSLNHIEYESNFLTYDIVEPKNFLIQSARKENLTQVDKIYSCLDQVPVDTKYDKIISIACLEHILDLQVHLVTIKKLLKKSGFFIVAIPAEGEFLWSLGWRLTTGLAFLIKYRLNYGVIMRFEHVNKAQEILAMLGDVFKIDEIHSYPFNRKHLRLYIVIKCSLKPASDES